MEVQLEENKIVALEINSPHYIMFCFLAPAKKTIFMGSCLDLLYLRILLLNQVTIRDANSLAIFIPRGFGELGIAFFHSSGIRGSKTYSSGGPRVTYYQIYPNLIKFQV